MTGNLIPRPHHLIALVLGPNDVSIRDIFHFCTEGVRRDTSSIFVCHWVGQIFPPPPAGNIILQATANIQLRLVCGKYFICMEGRWILHGSTVAQAFPQFGLTLWFHPVLFFFTKLKSQALLLFWHRGNWNHWFPSLCTHNPSGL